MLKIRLRRMGAIRQPHYRIVVADARSPRDGRFIESLGHYNPLTDPATIQIDVAKYEEWKSKGAQPTNAVASLVKLYGRAARKAAAEGEAAPTASRKTRTASGKGIAPPAAEAAPEAATEAAIETEQVDVPMNEAVAEATRDGGEGSEAMMSGGDMAADADTPAADDTTEDTAAAADTAADADTGGGQTSGDESDEPIDDAAETGGSANPGAADDEA